MKTKCSSIRFIGLPLILVAVMVIFGFAPYAQSQNPNGITRDEKGVLSKDFNTLYNDLRASRELPQQVFVEVNVFEVMIRDDDHIGFIYDILGELGEIRGTSLSGQDNIESDLGVLGSGFRKELLPAGANIVARIFEGDEGELRAVIQALAEDQIIKVHSNPILLTLEGIPARLETGEDIPYLERASLGNVETVVSRYRQTGVTLQVTPYVGYLETDVDRMNPFIRADIMADISTVSRFREEEGFTQPIVDSRKYTTNVWLKAGSRIIIGSLFRDSLSHVSRGIPILKDIPVLGRLFHSTQTSSNISQLYIIIRPVIFDIGSENSVMQERDFRSSSDNLKGILEERSRDVDVQTKPFDEFRDLLMDRTPGN